MPPTTILVGEQNRTDVLGHVTRAKYVMRQILEGGLSRSHVESLTFPHSRGDRAASFRAAVAFLCEHFPNCKAARYDDGSGTLGRSMGCGLAVFDASRFLHPSVSGLCLDNVLMFDDAREFQRFARLPTREEMLDADDRRAVRMTLLLKRMRAQVSAELQQDPAFAVAAAVSLCEAVPASV